MKNQGRARRHAPPKASALIESLRGLGYNTSTAIADLIDNSISANATTVAINFTWDGQRSRISILDDGNGMNAKELDRAMRLGEINPLISRSISDLGRFGMGLKTASFSQCRRLTVTSRKESEINTLSWDLDILGKLRDDDGWYMLEGAASGSEEYAMLPCGQQNGTLVLWEQLDRIVTQGYSQQDFLDLIDDVEAYLGMVFHRFIGGSRPDLRILINGELVKAWDPFIQNHSATNRFPAVNIGPNVVVQGYVLPHRDMLTQDGYKQGGGPSGWTSQQGFYVYRNRRLLVAGGWLGLGQSREEAHRLARIKLDISNIADEEWKIDIRKSTARPPANIRKQLITIADDIRARARKVYAFRGAPVDRQGRGRNQQLSHAWCADYQQGDVRYRIDRTHPVVQMFLEGYPEAAAQAESMLRVIEETVPVQRIWLDSAEGKDVLRTGFAGEEEKMIVATLEVFYRNLIERKGIAPDLAKAQLLRTEPFQNFPDLVKLLPDKYEP